MSDQIYIGADNAIIQDGIEDSTTGAYVNSGASVTFSIYRKLAEDGAITAGSTALTAPDSAPFVAGDVGRSIVVRGAGENGSDLRTTIAAFVSSTQVTLSTSAGKTVSDAAVRLSVTGAKDVVMSYVAASNGKYRGVLDASVPLRDGDAYWLEVTIDAGSGRQDFRQKQVVARYRQTT